MGKERNTSPARGLDGDVNVIMNVSNQMPGAEVTVGQPRVTSGGQRVIDMVVKSSLSSMHRGGELDALAKLRKGIQRS
jgi:hypothetical protein